MTLWAARARETPHRGALAAALESKSIINWMRRTWSAGIEPRPVALDYSRVVMLAAS